MNYYFLASTLSELQVGVPPEMGFQELLDLLKDNLTAVDYEKVMKIRRFYDIQNMRALRKGEELDKWGNLDQQELDEAILTGDEPLVADYFKSESLGFLHKYFAFEREWRLVLAAFRSKRLKYDLVKELQYEDPSDVLVAQILAQKDAFEPPEEYSQLKPLFEKHCDHPLDLHLALCEYRFEKVGEMIGVDRFSVDRILSYLVQYIIVDKTNCKETA